MKFVPIDAMRSEVCAALWQWFVQQGGETDWPPKDAFRPENLPARVLPHLGVVDED